MCSTVLGVLKPTEGLAPLRVQTVTEILGEITRRGTTIFRVEQTLEVAMRLSHRLYVVDQGRIQFEGMPDELRREPAIQQHSSASSLVALVLERAAPPRQAVLRRPDGRREREGP